MHLLVNDAVALTRHEFNQLLNYSHSLPTGTTPGKAWRAKRGDTWWRGAYGLPYPEGHKFHGQIPIGWRRIHVIGLPARFPRDIAVPPPPMRGRQIIPEPGSEEGALCLRSYPDGRPVCLGKLELRRDSDLGGCYCSTMRMPPCSSCMSEVPECRECGHREPEPC